jgi:hypothetical protein
LYSARIFFCLVKLELIVWFYDSNIHIVVKLSRDESGFIGFRFFNAGRLFVFLLLPLIPVPPEVAEPHDRKAQVSVYKIGRPAVRRNVDNAQDCDFKSEQND